MCDYRVNKYSNIDFKVASEHHKFIYGPNTCLIRNVFKVKGTVTHLPTSLSEEYTILIMGHVP